MCRERRLLASNFCISKKCVLRLLKLLSKCLRYLCLSEPRDRFFLNGSWEESCFCLEQLKCGSREVFCIFLFCFFGQFKVQPQIYHIALLQPLWNGHFWRFDIFVIFPIFCFFEPFFTWNSYNVVLESFLFASWGYFKLLVSFPKIIKKLKTRKCSQNSTNFIWIESCWKKLLIRYSQYFLSAFLCGCEQWNVTFQSTSDYYTEKGANKSSPGILLQECHRHINS